MPTISPDSFCRNMPEQRLMVAAWRDPATFCGLADAFGLAHYHFEDRLVSSVIAYLKTCLELGDAPRLSTFEAATRALAILYDQADFHRVFVETTIPAGTSIADLIGDVIECWEERDQREMNEIIVAKWREVNHVGKCPDCIRCANGQKRKSSTPRRARRIFEYAD